MKPRRFADLLFGAGGMALGIERAGFELKTSFDTDPASKAIAALNRPGWDVETQDIAKLDGTSLASLDLISAGLPSPSVSLQSSPTVVHEGNHIHVARECLRIITEARPSAVLLEGTLAYRRKEYRQIWAHILEALESVGYQAEARILYADQYGVPQRRPRIYLVGLLSGDFFEYDWPYVMSSDRTVGSTLRDEMGSRGWPGAEAWAVAANAVAPTIVGGSRRHGGADLGPSGSKAAWWRIGVDPTGVADEPPSFDAPLALSPRLTTSMLSKLQGFSEWELTGKKTARVRLIGSATPPPVAQSLAASIRDALDRKTRTI